ncbi:MAG: hypothetical protein AAF662_00175 [Pseudomonadota bacterium]
MLLDEPTAGVDPQARRDFWDEIHRLSLEGMTVLVSTHYMDEAERCDRIVYLANGEKVAEGTVADIIARSGLHTFRGEGYGVRQLSEQLKTNDALEHVAYFGAAQTSNVDWREVRSSLEDAFIALMADAGQDTRVHA